MSAPTYTKSGTRSAVATKLSKDVFGLEVKDHQLIKDVYVATMAANRTNNAYTKTRGEVRGGGKKPWRQKGTGRARFGSSRVPIWRGGGITFGPTGYENFTKRVSKSMRTTALKQAFSLASEKIVVIEDFETKDGKTAAIAKLMKKIGAHNRVLLVVAEKDTMIDRATRNLADVHSIQVNYLTVNDVLDANTIILSKKSVEFLDNWLKTKKAAK